MNLAPAADAPASLVALDRQAVEARSLPTTSVSPAEVRSSGWNVTDLWLPAVVCDGAALAHNLDRLASWCAEREVSLAPHGKTTMAPQLWAAQLARGAWGISAATVAQARTMKHHGVPRVLLVNEVVDRGQLRWLADAARDPTFELLCVVDSPEGVRVLDDAAGEEGATIPVLVELGVKGRRTGARTIEVALALAEAVAASRHLDMVGVEAYEGVWPARRDPDATGPARQWLEGVVDLARRCDERGLFQGAEIVLTAGGSAFVDLVADAFSTLGGLSRPLRRVVRPGCYVTHDHLSCERTSPLRAGAVEDPLRPALVCRAAVISTPEDGRSLLGVGKRDVAFDIDLPVPLTRVRGAAPLTGRAKVVELNDHHAFVSHEPGLLRVGDVVELGLSHPCTVFDKWSLIPVLDGHGRIVDAVRTIF